MMALLKFRLRRDFRDATSAQFWHLPVQEPAKINGVRKIAEILRSGEELKMFLRTQFVFPIIFLDFAGLFCGFLWIYLGGRPSQFRPFQVRLEQVVAMEPDFSLLTRIWCIAELVEARKLHLQQDREPFRGAKVCWTSRSDFTDLDLYQVVFFQNDQEGTNI